MFKEFLKIDDYIINFIRKGEFNIVWFSFNLNNEIEFSLTIENDKYSIFICENFITIKDMKKGKSITVDGIPVSVYDFMLDRIFMISNTLCVTNYELLKDKEEKIIKEIFMSS